MHWRKVSRLAQGWAGEGRRGAWARPPSSSDLPCRLITLWRFFSLPPDGRSRCWSLLSPPLGGRRSGGETCGTTGTRPRANPCNPPCLGSGRAPSARRRTSCTGAMTLSLAGVSVPRAISTGTPRRRCAGRNLRSARARPSGAARHAGRGGGAQVVRAGAEMGNAQTSFYLQRLDRRKREARRAQLP
jgi:hypothetical protein